MTTMAHRLFDLTGRVAIVTGGSRGLGLAMARGLAEAGATTVIASRTADEVTATVSEMTAAGLKADGIVADAADREDADRLVAETVDRHGKLDVMLVNHGVSRAQLAEEVDPESWDWVIGVNLTGAFYCAQAAGRQMLAQGSGGSIIFTSSTASMVGFRKLLAYGASKGGVDQMVRQLAVEWGDRNIRVNAINPGWTTHNVRGTEARHADPALNEEVRLMTPMQRRGAAEEFVGPAIFLASDAGSFVSGVCLAVDGGYCAM